MCRSQLLLGRLMLFGAIFSALFASVGGGLLLWQHGTETISFHLFNPANSYIINYYSARGLIEVGLYILVLTQVLRVALTGWMFIEQGDKWFIAFSLFILAVLIYSLFP